MSRLEELINELCPDGVEYKKISAIFDVFNGMTGVSLKWKENGNCQFIDYMNVYKNNKVDINNTPYATVNNLNQNQLMQKDILITTASELPEECAISAVIEDKIKENIFLDDHLFGLRLKNNYYNLINTTYVNYYMNTLRYRKEVLKKVKGVTRFFVSPNDIVKIEIPIPPLQVQEEIVRILDNFTELTNELTNELEFRKKQYEWYKDDLFKCYSKSCKYLKLENIAKIYDGTHSTPSYQETGIPFVSVENIKNLNGTSKFISKDAFEKFKIKPKTNDIFMTRIGSVGECSLVLDNNPLAYYVSLALIRVNETIVLPKYIKYYIESSFGKKELSKRILHNAVPIKINKDDIGKIHVFYPTLEEQQRIVDILDKFDAYCNDLTQGLPAEIELRKKQYEYYRDRLLTFKRLEEK